jgi:hypothetical protein
MTTYLEEAARHLREAEADLADGRSSTTVPARVMSWDQHMEQADRFTRLAAIERGLLPPDWQPPALGDERGIVLPRRETG